MKRETTTKTDKVTFESFGDFVSFAETRTLPVGGVTHSRDNTSSGTWDLNANFDATVQLAKFGWPDGANRVKALAGKLTTNLSHLIEMPVISYDVMGENFDAGVFCEGKPECFFDIHSQIEEFTGTGKIVRLVFNSTASCGISAQVMAAKGAMICALIQCLEIAGIRVEVILTFATRGQKTYGVEVPIKDADQNLDLDRLVFSLAHPACFRRLGFSVLESSETFAKDCGGSYGCPTSVDTPCDIKVPESSWSDSQWLSEDTAIAWITGELKKQGVHLEG